MPVLKIALDQPSYEALANDALAEDRHIPGQASVLIHRALGLTAPQRETFLRDSEDGREMALMERHAVAAERMAAAQESQVRALWQVEGVLEHIAGALENLLALRYAAHKGLDVDRDEEQIDRWIGIWTAGAVQGINADVATDDDDTSPATATDGGES